MKDWGLNAFGGDEGFTLLELLVAIGLFSGLMLLAHEGLTGFIRARSFAADTMKDQQQNALLKTLFRHLLERAYPFDSRRDPDVRQYPMEGDDRSLSFTAAPATTSPMRRFHLVFDRSKGQVKLSDCPEMAEQSGSQGECQAVILAGAVARLEVAYGVIEAGHVQWRSRWQRQTDLPRLVKLSLFDDKGSLKDTPLIIRPRIDEWAHCSFDPVSRRCR